jgi:hypothetical protein
VGRCPPSFPSRFHEERPGRWNRGAFGLRPAQHAARRDRDTRRDDRPGVRLVEAESADASEPSSCTPPSEQGRRPALAIAAAEALRDREPRRARAAPLPIAVSSACGHRAGPRGVRVSPWPPGARRRRLRLVLRVDVGRIARTARVRAEQVVHESDAQARHGGEHTPSPPEHAARSRGAASERRCSGAGVIHWTGVERRQACRRTGVCGSRGSPWRRARS